MRFLIRSGGINLLVNCSDEFGKKLIDFKFLYQYIPDVSVSEDFEVYKKCENYIDIKIDKHDYLFSFDGKKGVIEGSLESNISLYDVVTLMDHVLEYLRQEAGIYCLHGSAVSSLNRGVWFMGSISGLGKTTIALNLCLRNNFGFIGDEKVLIDRDGLLMGGVKNISYNKEGLLSSINENFDGRDQMELASKVCIEEKVVPLALVICPIVLPNCNVLEEDKWETRKASFHFYEELSRKIRGVSRRINNFCVPVQSIDDEKIALERSNFANIIVERVPFYLLKGSKEKITDRIKEIIDISRD